MKNPNFAEGGSQSLKRARGKGPAEAFRRVISRFTSLVLLKLACNCALGRKGGNDRCSRLKLASLGRKKLWDSEFLRLDFLQEGTLSTNLVNPGPGDIATNRFS